MELDPEKTRGSWTIADNEKTRFFIISEAIISKLCILGEDYEPCFEGAGISKFSLEDDFNQKIYALMKKVRELKGGSSSVEDNNIVEPVVEEVEVEPVAEYEVTEEVVETEPEVEAETAPEEVEPARNYEAEIAEMQSNYSALEDRYNELLNNYNALETEVNGLRAFKLTKDREAK